MTKNNEEYAIRFTNKVINSDNNIIKNCYDLSKNNSQILDNINFHANKVGQKQSEHIVRTVKHS